MDEGYVFGKRREGFQRINLACSRTILKEALDRICMAMKNVKQTVNKINNFEK